MGDTMRALACFHAVGVVLIIALTLCVVRRLTRERDDDV